jgi:hypothetical protein
MNGAFSFSHAQARSLHRVRACVRLAIFRISHCHWVCTQGLVRWFTRDAVKDETPNSLRQTVQKEEEERLMCLSKDTRSIRRQLKRFQKATFLFPLHPLRARTHTHTHTHTYTHIHTHTHTHTHIHTHTQREIATWIHGNRHTNRYRRVSCLICMSTVETMQHGGRWARKD